jgi:hypothetical protein
MSQLALFFVILMKVSTEGIRVVVTRTGPHGFWLGHYTNQDGGFRRYQCQPLPPRPAEGKEEHLITCDVCQQPIHVTIMDETSRFNARALKVVPAALVGLIAVGMAMSAAKTPSNPETFQQPDWVVGAVWGWVAVVLTCVCLLAYGVRDSGIRLRIPRGSAASRGTLGHRVVRR